MTVNTPDDEIARHDALVAMARTALSELADRHRARTGRVHPFWGNGSLMAAARAHPLAPEPDFDNDSYCACMELVLRALVDWRISQTRN
ncbi:hypothetical protein SuNHUV7_35510 (plasmid) [Pseudoseohaeicola sp. NH-UV-7]|uniref:DUF7742 family protein n=1 Tax=Sulfitobacter sp. TBRI5 TaxID=2989732 RepID=UPI003A772646